LIVVNVRVRLIYFLAKELFKKGQPNCIGAENYKTYSISFGAVPDVKQRTTTGATILVVGSGDGGGIVGPHCQSRLFPFIPTIMYVKCPKAKLMNNCCCWCTPPSRLSAHLGVLLLFISLRLSVTL
jgi:hypothetical protein